MADSPSFFPITDCGINHWTDRLDLALLVLPNVRKEDTMAWTTPVLVEVCIGLEINGYLPADGYVPPEF